MTIEICVKVADVAKVPLKDYHSKKNKKKEKYQKKE
jgi:hypothetical protein